MPTFNAVSNAPIELQNVVPQEPPQNLQRDGEGAPLHTEAVHANPSESGGRRQGSSQWSDVFSKATEIDINIAGLRLNFHLGWGFFLVIALYLIIAYHGHLSQTSPTDQASNALGRRDFSKSLETAVQSLKYPHEENKTIGELEYFNRNVIFQAQQEAVKISMESLKSDPLQDKTIANSIVSRKDWFFSLSVAMLAAIFIRNGPWRRYSKFRQVAMVLSLSSFILLTIDMVDKNSETEAVAHVAVMALFLLIPIFCSLSVRFVVKDRALGPRPRSLD